VSLEWQGPSPLAKMGASPCQERLLRTALPQADMFFTDFTSGRATDAREGAILQKPVV